MSTTESLSRRQCPDASWTAIVEALWAIGLFSEVGEFPDYLKPAFDKFPELFALAILYYSQIKGMPDYREKAVISPTEHILTGELAMHTREIDVTRTESVQGGWEIFGQRKGLVTIEDKGRLISIRDYDGNPNMLLKVWRGPKIFPVPFSLLVRVWGELYNDKVVDKVVMNEGKMHPFALVGPAWVRALIWPDSLPPVKKFIAAFTAKLKMTAEEPTPSNTPLRRNPRHGKSGSPARLANDYLRPGDPIVHHGYKTWGMTKEGVVVAVWVDPRTKTAKLRDPDPGETPPEMPDAMLALVQGNDR